MIAIRAPQPRWRVLPRAQSGRCNPQEGSARTLLGAHGSEARTHDGRPELLHPRPADVHEADSATKRNPAQPVLRSAP